MAPRGSGEETRMVELVRSPVRPALTTVCRVETVVKTGQYSL
jgi:hypothetical protein